MDFSTFEHSQQAQQRGNVHRLVQTIVQRLRDQRVVWNPALADDVFQAGDLVGKHRREQILALHALQLRRHLAAALEARQRERGHRVPAPAQAEHRCVEQGLDQHMLGGARVQIAGDFVERKTVAGRQRQHDCVLGRRGLQFEVERAAEALAQGEAPGAVHAAAEWRVDDELGAAGLVEEAFHRELCLRRQQTECGLRRAEVVDDLACAGFIQADLFAQPAQGRRGAEFKLHGNFFAQARHGIRQLVAASGRLAEPER